MLSSAKFKKLECGNSAQVCRQAFKAFLVVTEVLKQHRFRSRVIGLYEIGLGLVGSVDAEEGQPICIILAERGSFPILFPNPDLSTDETGTDG